MRVISVQVTLIVVVSKDGCVRNLAVDQKLYRLVQSTLGQKCEADPRTLEFVERLLDEEKPDMVVFSGDQVNGEISVQVTLIVVVSKDGCVRNLAVDQKLYRLVQCTLCVWGSEKPDMVVFSGDQVNGETAPDAQSALYKSVKLLVDRKIPYAAIFGNRRCLRGRRLQESKGGLHIEP
jgi:predicted MPP superfamily phosphohydrolase